MGNVIDGSAGFTLPPNSIFVGKGVYGNMEYLDLLQHEFGHILEYRNIGLKAYYSMISPESMASFALNGIAGHSHDNFWTETWANYLSNEFFGSRSLLLKNPIKWPAQDLSLFNKIRLGIKMIMP